MLAYARDLLWFIGQLCQLTCARELQFKKVLCPLQAFTDAAMREYLPTIMAVATQTLEQWADSAEPLRFYHAARAFAFDIAATVLTGVRFHGDRLSKPLLHEPLLQMP